MGYLVIVLTYVFCHGLTTFVVAPVQEMMLPELTVFASLIYLPHGVRVLATWAYGWKAVPALFLGASISIWFFRPADELNFLEPALLESLVLGATSAFLSFELVRLFGSNYYFGGEKTPSWKGMVLIGAISSVVNSIGQTFVFSGLIGLNQLSEVLVIYAIGDLVGLVVCMVALMFVFRWQRHARNYRRQ